MSIRFGQIGDPSMTDSDYGQTIARVWLTAEEVQRRTGISRTEIYAALQSGELVGHQRVKHRKWRVHIDDVDAWVRGEVAAAGRPA